MSRVRATSIDGRLRYIVACAFMLAAAQGIASCGHQQAERRSAPFIEFTFGSEETAQTSPRYGAGYVGAPGAFGLPPDLPIEQIRWFLSPERGLVLGDMLLAVSADQLVDDHLDSILVTTHRRDGEYTYSGASWERARSRVEFLQQTWSSNYLVAAGIAAPDAPANLQAILAEESWGATEDDARALGSNVLQSGQSPLGDIERIIFGETIRLSWLNFDSCVRSTFEFEPLFALVPEEEEVLSVVLIAETADGDWCSLAVEASESRMALFIEDRCTDYFPPGVGVGYSGGLAPTEFTAFPPQVDCDVHRPASLPMSGDRR